MWKIIIAYSKSLTFYDYYFTVNKQIKIAFFYSKASNNIVFLKKGLIATNKVLIHSLFF